MIQILYVHISTVGTVNSSFKALHNCFHKVKNHLFKDSRCKRMVPVSVLECL